MKKRKSKRAFRLLTVGVAICASILALLWYYSPFGQPFCDGPFHGMPTAQISARKPSQTMEIFNGMTLEVYDPEKEGESPIVQLREGSSVRWAVFVDGNEIGDVSRIRFQRYELGFGRSGVVYGGVKWMFGSEATYWIITRSGELQEYYYSW